MKKQILLLVALAVLMASCADSVNVEKCLPDDPYGFWSGLLHGWIALPSFIVSLFNDDVAVYAVNNNGGWYDFGFILGIGSTTTTASQASRR